MLGPAKSTEKFWLVLRLVFQESLYAVVSFVCVGSTCLVEASFYLWSKTLSIVVVDIRLFFFMRLIWFRCGTNDLRFDATESCFLLSCWSKPLKFWALTL